MEILFRAFWKAITDKEMHTGINTYVSINWRKNTFYYNMYNNMHDRTCIYVKVIG
jgi:hypothetical protein